MAHTKIFQISKTYKMIILGFDKRFELTDFFGARVSFFKPISALFIIISSEKIFLIEIFDLKKNEPFATSTD